MNNNIQALSSQYIPLANSEFVRFVGVYLNALTGATITATVHFDSSGRVIPNDDPKLEGLVPSKAIVGVVNWMSESSAATDGKIVYREFVHLEGEGSTWYNIEGSEGVKLDAKPTDLAGISVEAQASQGANPPIIIQQPVSDTWELVVGDYLDGWQSKTYTVEAFSREDKTANLFDNPNLPKTVDNENGAYSIDTSLLAPSSPDEPEYRKGFWRIAVS